MALSQNSDKIRHFQLQIDPLRGIRCDTETSPNSKIDQENGIPYGTDRYSLTRSLVHFRNFHPPTTAYDTPRGVQCNPQSVGRVWARLGFPRRTLFGRDRAQSELTGFRQPVATPACPAPHFTQGDPTNQIQRQIQFLLQTPLVVLMFAHSGAN